MDDAEIVNIDPRGDVVLICGGQNERIIKLVVSSHALIRGSRVFQALLSNHFKEGSQLAATSTVEVALPEDDAESMTIICNAIHARNNSIPDTLDDIDVMTVAMLTDKYECMEAMKHVVKKWVLPSIGSNDPSSLSIFLAAAFYFDDSWLFENVGKNLVLRSIGRIQSDDHSCLIALKPLLEALEVQRQGIFDSIASRIEREVQWCSMMRCEKKDCFYSQVYSSKFIEKLDEDDFWLTTDRKAKTVEQIWQYLYTFSFETPSTPPGSEHQNCVREELLNDERDVVSGLHQKAWELKQTVKFPCFQCAKGESFSLNKTCSHRSEAAAKEFWTSVFTPLKASK